MSKFAFELGDEVIIAVSGERGTVIGRAEYLEGSTTQYLVRYRTNQGEAVEKWWSNKALIYSNL